MGTYGDRNVPDPGNAEIQAGNQQQRQHVEDPNPMAGVIADISERRGRCAPGPSSNITFVNGIAQKK
eukprot:10337730-Prorocentrum_lima.AAC.1